MHVVFVAEKDGSVEMDEADERMQAVVCAKDLAIERLMKPF